MKCSFRGNDNIAATKVHKIVLSVAKKPIHECKIKLRAAKNLFQTNWSLIKFK